MHCNDCELEVIFAYFVVVTHRIQNERYKVFHIDCTEIENVSLDLR